MKLYVVFGDREQNQEVRSVRYVVWAEGPEPARDKARAYARLRGAKLHVDLGRIYEIEGDVVAVD